MKTFPNLFQICTAKRKGCQSWNQHHAICLALSSNCYEVAENPTAAVWNHHAHTPTAQFEYGKWREETCDSFPKCDSLLSLETKWIHLTSMNCLDHAKRDNHLALHLIWCRLKRRSGITGNLLVHIWSDTYRTEKEQKMYHLKSAVEWFVAEKMQMTFPFSMIQISHIIHCYYLQTFRNTGEWLLDY